MTYKFAESQSMGEILEQLSDESIIICPDTCILLHMVKESKKTEQIPPLKKLHLWEKEAYALEKLINNEKIVWVITQQIVREFEKNLEEGHLDEVFCKFKETLVGDTQYLDEIGSDKRYNSFCDKIDEVGDLIKKNRKTIVDTVFVLEDGDREPIYAAWKQVCEYEFPNEKKQQMKDTVILQYLLKLKEKLDDQGLSTMVYFWTFDRLGNGNSSPKFPKKESQPKNPKSEVVKLEKSQSYVDIVIGSANENHIFRGIIS